MQVVPVLESTVLPQTQAGFASWSGPALCTIPKGALNQMARDQLHRNSALEKEEECADRYAADQAEHVAARSTIGKGTRAINRLVLSLWFLLIPMIWPSSDWIGLIILSQAFFVAAKLVQPTIRKENSAASPEGAVLKMDQGGDCVQG